ncbi:uncharacterized protein F4817DRAFT_101042 [Daldinia loculata]|uniref:uncharacterized protein n=1 Tax=Daldinia loculata TaxID=103429 RepID=UPI0020C3A120|nr:uncharacterized protein F4817DRAFT_101042 [Daldinia loculata]KAI1647517.1 hypothetical protein F4817DRAFT_101042 [Daldinia loculata]
MLCHGMRRLIFPLRFALALLPFFMHSINLSPGYLRRNRMALEHSTACVNYEPIAMRILRIMSCMYVDFRHLSALLVSGRGLLLRS